MDVFTLIPNDQLDVSMTNGLLLVETCNAALTEGVTDPSLVDISRKNVMSVIFQFLDQCYTILKKLAEQVLIILNNYILNSANLADKYRSIIKEKYKSLSSPMLIHTYEFPHLYDNNYPNIIDQGKLHPKLDALLSNIKYNNLSAGEATYEVDDTLMDISNQIIGSSVDPSDIAGTTRTIVTQYISGQNRVIRITEKDLDKFMDEIKDYHKMRESIKKTQANVKKDYTTLMKLYGKVSQEQISTTTTGIQDMKAPQTQRLEAEEYKRFNDINLEMSRLLSGIITIYNASYNTKLEILKKKIEYDRKVLSALMVNTGTFAAINAKNPTVNSKPYDFTEIKIQL